MSKVWSEQQQNAITAVMEGKFHMLIRSVAGSGKTSVIVEAAKHVPRNSVFLAFNKKIVQELEGRLPTHCKASTFHSLCFSFLKDRLGKNVKIDKYKSLKLCQKHADYAEDAKWEVARLVGLLKNNGVGIFTRIEADIVEDVREAYDITSEDVSNSEIVMAAMKVLKLNEKDIFNIDFDDMVYLSLKFVKERGWGMDKHPVVFVDEAQDTNEVQLELLAEMAERVIGVGDDAQAIYGFRGAGANSMEAIKERFDCQEFDMSISWRCPQKVAELARMRVPEFRSRDGAPMGEVLEVSEGILMDNLRAQDLVVCRQNFPLLKIALKLLKSKTSFNMSGKFPEQLVNFVKGFNAGSIPEFRKCLQEWWDAKEKELLAANKQGALMRESDKFESLMELQKVSTSVADLVFNLESIMTNKGGISLSTIHGAKGLEAKTVVFLQPELLPSKYAVTEEQLMQEDNLRYVAQTRAQERLILVKGERNGKTKN